MTELLAQAFKVLAPGVGAQELADVAAAVRHSGDEKSIALLERAARETATWDELRQLAEANGADGFAVLDLVSEGAVR